MNKNGLALPDSVEKILDLRLIKHLLIVLLGVTIGILVLALNLKTALLIIFSGLAFVIILYKPEVGFLMTVATIPLYIAGALVSSSATITMSIAKILGLFTLFAWLIQVMVIKKYKLIFVPHFKVLVIFWLSALTSLIFAIDMQRGYAGIFRLVAIFGFYFLLTNITNSRQFLHKSIVIFVVASTLVAIFAIIQRYIPFFQMEEYDPSAYGVFIQTAEPSLGPVVRSMGFTNSNLLAISLLMVIPLSLYLLRVYKSDGVKTMLVMALIAQIVATLLTYTRMSLLGLGGVFLIVTGRRLLKITPILVTFMIAFILLAYIILPSVFWQRSFSIEHFKVSESISARWDLLQAGWQIFKNNWLMGIGTGSLDRHLPLYSKYATWVTPRDPNISVHNAYFEVAAEQGILGLFLLLLFIWLTMKDTWEAIKIYGERGDSQMYFLSTAVEASFIIGFIFCNLFVSALIMKEIWLIAGFAIVLKRIAVMPNNEK